MGIENATWPSELDETLPFGSDFKNEGDNHLRLIKTVIKNALGSTQGLASQVEAQAQTSQSNIKLMTVLRSYEAVTARLIGQTDAETAADNVKLMTALRTKQQIDARLIGQAAAETGTDNTKLLTALRANELITARLSDQTTAETGTNNVKLMTPLRVAQSAVKIFNDNYNNRIASSAEAIAGEVNTKTLTPLGGRQHGDARYLLISQTTAFSRSLLDDTSAGGMRNTLGLSAAATASISSSVSSTSTTVLANSNAVKTAYDRGSTALSTANSKYPGTADNYTGIGSFIFAEYVPSSITSVASGATVSGSLLRAAVISNSNEAVTSGSGLPGTWRNMGGTASGSGGSGTTGLWVRIS